MNDTLNKNDSSSSVKPASFYTSFSDWEYQNIALSVVVQCTQLVHSLAQDGKADEQEILACITPLLITKPRTTQDIYPNVSAFSSGLKTLQQSLESQKRDKNIDVIRYVMSLLLLRSKLMNNNTMQKYIHNQIQLLSPVALQQPFEDSALSGQLAELYQETISTLPHRVQVHGKIEHLKNEQTANKIRALLLAGIRSAVLWHQLGGRRWRLLVYRNRIKATVIKVRRKLITSV